MRQPCKVWLDMPRKAAISLKLNRGRGTSDNVRTAEGAGLAVAVGFALGFARLGAAFFAASRLAIPAPRLLQKSIFVIAKMWLVFSQVYRNRGLFNDALKLVTKSLEMKEIIYGPNHPSIAESLETQANIHYHQCNFNDAEEILYRSLRIQKDAFGENHPDVGNTLQKLGYTHLAMGEYNEALNYFQQSLQ